MTNLARVYLALAKDGNENEKKGEGKPLLLMAFGGGDVLGTVKSEETVCRNWIKECGGVGVSVGYRYGFVSQRSSISI